MARPGTQQRRLRHREDAQRAILDAAEELLRDGGLDAFSMRRLGERSGFTAPTLYHYFRDKPALLEALLEERLRELVDELRGLPEAPGLAARVATLSAAFVRFGLRYPAHYQLLVLRYGENGLESPAATELEAIFGEPLDELARRGTLGAREIERLRQGIWSFLHGFIVLQTTRPPEDWEPDLLEATLDAMIRGTLAGAEARS